MIRRNYGWLVQGAATTQRVTTRPVDSGVRDGRHLMQNDGLGESSRVCYVSNWFTPTPSLAATVKSLVLTGEWFTTYGEPEHPNYRAQYQRIGEQAV